MGTLASAASSGDLTWPDVAGLAIIAVSTLGSLWIFFGRNRD